MRFISRISEFYDISEEIKKTISIVEQKASAKKEIIKTIILLHTEADIMANVDNGSGSTNRAKIQKTINSIINKENKNISKQWSRMRNSRDLFNIIWLAVI